MWLIEGARKGEKEKERGGEGGREWERKKENQGGETQDSLQSQSKGIGILKHLFSCSPVKVFPMGYNYTKQVIMLSCLLILKARDHAIFCKTLNEDVVWLGRDKASTHKGAVTLCLVHILVRKGTWMFCQDTS